MSSIKSILGAQKNDAQLIRNSWRRRALGAHGFRTESGDQSVRNIKTAHEAGDGHKVYE